MYNILVANLCDSIISRRLVVKKLETGTLVWNPSFRAIIRIIETVSPWFSLVSRFRTNKWPFLRTRTVRPFSET